jgi:hypothetical protein
MTLLTNMNPLLLLDGYFALERLVGHSQFAPSSCLGACIGWWIQRASSFGSNCPSRNCARRASDGNVFLMYGRSRGGRTPP